MCGFTPSCCFPDLALPPLCPPGGDRKQSRLTKPVSHAHTTQTPTHAPTTPCLISYHDVTWTLMLWQKVHLPISFSPQPLLDPRLTGYAGGADAGIRSTEFLFFRMWFSMLCLSPGTHFAFLAGEGWTAFSDMLSATAM